LFQPVFGLLRRLLGSYSMVVWVVMAAPVIGLIASAGFVEPPPLPPSRRGRETEE
jgi:hypothetical protein